MDDLPNKIVNHLGLVVDVNVHNKAGKHYIEIIVPVSTVSYKGLERMEPLEYPEPALREAILNAVLCKHLHTMAYVTSNIM